MVESWFETKCEKISGVVKNNYCIVDNVKTLDISANLEWGEHFGDIIEVNDKPFEASGAHLFMKDTHTKNLKTLEVWSTGTTLEFKKPVKLKIDKYGAIEIL